MALAGLSPELQVKSDPGVFTSSIPLSGYPLPAQSTQLTLET